METFQRQIMFYCFKEQECTANGKFTKVTKIYVSEDRANKIMYDIYKKRTPGDDCNAENGCV